MLAAGGGAARAPGIRRDGRLQRELPRGARARLVRRITREFSAFTLRGMRGSPGYFLAAALLRSPSASARICALSLPSMRSCCSISLPATRPGDDPGGRRTARRAGSAIPLLPAISSIGRSKLVVLPSLAAFRNWDASSPEQASPKGCARRVCPRSFSLRSVCRRRGGGRSPRGGVRARLGWRGCGEFRLSEKPSDRTRPDHFARRPVRTQ